MYQNKKVLFITTSFTQGGNGDILTEKAIEAANTIGAKTSRIDLRYKHIEHCHGCNGCIAMSKCVHDDDMPDILEEMVYSNSIIISLPIMFNMPNGLAITFFDRNNTLFAPKFFNAGNRDWKVGIIATLGKTSYERDMGNIIEKSLALSSRIAEYRVETFSDLSTRYSCYDRNDYLLRAADLGRWAAN